MRITQSHHVRLSKSEQGMVSIMTTMILIIVVSLIVLGFAQLSRRNQREALDRQLSTQAFYAAESGVNDARNRINTAINSGSTIPAKTSCTDTASGFYNTTNIIDTNASVRYSCLLVDPAPKILRYTDVGTNSVVFPVASSTPLTSIKLDWQSKITSGDPTTGCPTSLGTFSPTTSWVCGYGVLRFDLVPTNGSFSAGDLQNRTMTSFVVPFNNSGSAANIPYGGSTSNSNVRVGTRCTSAGCSVTIDVSSLATNNFYMRVSSIYRNVSMQVTGYNGTTQLGLTGAQALIDATGRAQDVLRRVQVSVPLRANSQNDVSDYAIQSTDSLCKRFSVMENYFDSDASGVTSANRLCQP